MINVKDLAPGIVLDLRYATPNNFTGETLYPVAECLLCEPAAKRLAAVQKKLESQGLGLKVWDCYRPISIQKKLWSIVPDDRYVADPKTGSRHNRGASVDLTLVDKHGRELEMPTGFDDFSEKAHRNYSNLSATAIKNRALLQNAMEAEGFMGLPTEWWHFDSPEWKNYALRDEPLGSASLKEEKKTVPPLPFNSTQLIIVRSSDWSSVDGTLTRYSKNGTGWTADGPARPVVLGLKGMAWGVGLNAPVDGPQKQESDLKAPAGVFPLGVAFGYAPNAPDGVRWKYQSMSSTWRCVDDPKSSHYNQIFDSSTVKKDWTSAEQMHRDDHLYKWGLNIEQNFPAVKPYCGSCIFFHIWRRPGAGTEGCTAMAEEDLLILMKWADPAKHPLVIQLPTETYEKVKKEWGLP